MSHLDVDIEIKNHDIVSAYDTEDFLCTKAIGRFCVHGYSIPCCILGCRRRREAALISWRPTHERQQYLSVYVYKAHGARSRRDVPPVFCATSPTQSHIPFAYEVLREQSGSNRTDTQTTTEIRRREVRRISCVVDNCCHTTTPRGPHRRSDSSLWAWPNNYGRKLAVNLCTRRSGNGRRVPTHGVIA